MNEVEFYSKAQSDVSFRQQQMDEATYLEKLNKTGFGLGVIAMAGYATYCGIAQHRLVDLEFSGIAGGALLAWSYTQLHEQETGNPSRHRSMRRAARQNRFFNRS